MSDENPLEAQVRQLEFDISELKTDAGLVQNEELRVLIRNLIHEKRTMILAMWKEYGEIAGV